MVGAVEEIKKIEDFDNSCIKEVWRYEYLNSTFVAIPKTNKEIIFKEYAKFTNCEYPSRQRTFK